MSVVVELLMVITNLIGSVNKRKKRKSISEKLAGLAIGSLMLIS